MTHTLRHWLPPLPPGGRPGAAGLPSRLLPGALAQSGGPYNLTWSTGDGGGETFSTGGGYRLGGSAGQPDAELLSSGPYTLRGGFWVDGLTIPVDYEYDTYLPLVLR